MKYRQGRNTQTGEPSMCVDLSKILSKVNFKRKQLFLCQFLMHTRTQFWHFLTKAKKNDKTKQQNIISNEVSQDYPSKKYAESLL